MKHTPTLAGGVVEDGFRWKLLWKRSGYWCARLEC